MSLNQGNDVTVCFISSQNVANLSAEEFAIASTNSEFAATGLKTDSKVRVSRFNNISKRDKNLSA
ncbi:hypothetical protein [Hydrococcus rivularis]|uniref:hypothetical protein n=1 Tax=Hydrococcus rivularis TaxID=1616834 RepID=UPI000B04056D|nr:hypothetical protein [Hydrococcus rivularis]